MWIKSENDRSVKPESVETSGDIIIVRKGFRLIPTTDERPEHWEYDEWQMNKGQYEVYHEMETALSEQSDALVELAELITEGME